MQIAIITEDGSSRIEGWPITYLADLNKICASYGTSTFGNDAVSQLYTAIANLVAVYKNLVALDGAVTVTQVVNPPTVDANGNDNTDPNAYILHTGTDGQTVFSVKVLAPTS